MFHLLHSSRSWRALSLLIFGLLLSLPVRAGEGDDPLITNDYSEPSELVGVVEVNVLVGGEVVLDWSSPTLPVLESPTVLSMPQTPFGQAYFVGSDLSSSVYTLALPTGHAISLKWDPKLGRYSGWIGGYQVLVHYKPPTTWTYVPGLGMVAIVPVCLKGKWVGVTPTLIRPPGLSNDIDWI